MSKNDNAVKTDYRSQEKEPALYLANEELKIFLYLKMSECEPFSKGSLSIEQVQRKSELFSQLVKIANRWILTPVEIRFFVVINNIVTKKRKEVFMIYIRQIYLVI